MTLLRLGNRFSSRVRRTGVGVVGIGLATGLGTATLCGQVDFATELRIEIVGGTPEAPEAEAVPWTVPAMAPAPACVSVQADVVLISRVEPCFSEPSLCDQTENFTRTGDDGIPMRFSDFG